MTRPEKAEALFRSGYNCAQSVVMAFAPDFGLTQEAQPALRRGDRQRPGEENASLRDRAGFRQGVRRAARLVHLPRVARARPGAGFTRPRSAYGRVLQPPPLRKICACGRRAARTLFIAAFGFPSRKRRGNPAETPPLSGIRRGRSGRRRGCLRRSGLRRRFQKTSPPHKAGGVLTE